MLKRSYAITLLALFLVPFAAAAQERKLPAAVVRVRSFDALIQNIKVIAKAVDKEEVGNQLEPLIKGWAGPNGLAGVDTKRPIGFYGNFGAEKLSSISGVLMIPIQNEKAFLKLLENLNYKAIKQQNGSYEVRQDFVPGLPVAFRFANKYAYVTVANLDAIDKGNLVSPVRIFPPNERALVSGTLRMDQVPKSLKDIAITKMEEELAKEKKKGKPGETEAQRKLRHTVIDTYAEMAADFLSGATEVSGGLDINARAGMITGRLFVDSKKNSKLRVHIRELTTRSAFGSLAGKNKDLAVLLNYDLPKNMRKAFTDVIQEEIAKVLKKETNPKKRKQAEAILKALEPSIKAGELVSGAAIQMHDDGPATVVAGVKVKNGRHLEQTVRELVTELPAQDRERIKLDAAKVGDTHIHQLDVHDKLDEKAKKLLGDNPFYIAFRDDAVMFAAGKNGLQALKMAAAARPQPVPAIQVELELGKLTPLLDEERDRIAAKKVFGKGAKGIIRFSLRGGEVLNGRFEMSLPVLQFFTEVGKAKKRAEANSQR